MTAKSVLVRPQGLRPVARALTSPLPPSLCYATDFKQFCSNSKALNANCCELEFNFRKKYVEGDDLLISGFWISFFLIDDCPTTQQTIRNRTVEIFADLLSIFAKTHQPKKLSQLQKLSRFTVYTFETEIKVAS